MLRLINYVLSSFRGTSVCAPLRVLGVMTQRQIYFQTPRISKSLYNIERPKQALLIATEEQKCLIDFEISCQRVLLLVERGLEYQ